MFFQLNSSFLGLHHSLVNFFHMALFSDLPGKSLITEAALDLSFLVFLLEVPLEDDLGREVLATD